MNLIEWKLQTLQIWGKQKNQIMKSKVLKVVLGLCLFSGSIFAQESNSTEDVPQDVHRDPTHNFTMQRLLILNDKNEVLMCREDYVWATPAAMYSQRQYIKEGLDSLANAYGVKISAPKLRGYFSYKYNYHPHSTLRSYYVAKYQSGTIQIPPGTDEVKWVPLPEAIEMNTVTSIKQITAQLLKFPDTVWGGSFMVYRNEKGHPTEQVEAFYPLFE